MPEMISTPESSNVESIGYDESNEEVWVSFRASTYVYEGVPAHVWIDFRESGSKGSFVNATLIPGYVARRA